MNVQEDTTADYANLGQRSRDNKEQPVHNAGQDSLVGLVSDRR
jgi:hypothetical protein